LLNLMLTAAPWVPAILIWIFLTSWCWRRIEATYPSHENKDRHTALCLVTILGTLFVFFGVWCVGMLLTEGLRCAFA
jgi:hypothetical protein